ncbi:MULTISPECIES: hypothetical protein [Sphingobacterium]|uniref:Thiamine diphosphokinase n=1 Tax=Sphingobacterium populi TaxID=1812824 RepID=A0ABW5UC03_9SPHI|nr:hypothetical protein [Sphingobacterium sp. CFCC 11742]
MSSHHIIRENQEPALLIIDSDALSEESLGQLLEWSPIVLTTDANVDYLLSRGIKIDVVFTANADFEIDQDAISILPLQHILWDALHYLKSKNQFALHILWNDFSADALIQHSQQFTFAVYSQQFKYILRSSFHKWMPQGSVLKVMSGGAAYRVDNLQAAANETYHSLQDGFVSIHSESENSLIIGEAL